jgi:NTE family protein
MEWITEADGVFRGGGVKGVALTGALDGFANHPTKPVTKWVNVAGASAGAIIACYLATDHTTDQLMNLLQDTPFARFEDPPGGSLSGRATMILRHGYARGNFFEDWLNEQLEQSTFGTLQPRDASTDGEWRLKLIAVDATKRRLLVLPEDLKHYRDPKNGQAIEPASFGIARAARMSMSIPYFFEPITLLDLEDRTECSIIDGGTLSNFPVWLFDVDPSRAGHPPRRPTFGFTLTGGRGFATHQALRNKLTPWPLRFAFDIFHTAQDAWDTRFMSHSTYVRTVAVDADDVAATDFDLKPDKRNELFENGRRAARAFLDEFSLDEYMNTFHARLEGATTTPSPVPPNEGVRT